MRRNGRSWNPKLPIWTQEGKLWTCARADLKKVILDSGVSEEIMRSRTGFGFHLIADALAGKALDKYEVNMVEYGIDKSEPAHDHDFSKLCSGWKEQK